LDKTQFLDKYQALQTPANAELVAVLKLWLPEGKSDDEIAAALGKNRSTATRKIGDICKYFGTDTKGKKEQRQQLVLLFRRYCSDFEVHSSLYPDWVEPNSIATKPENIVSDIVPITPIASTEFDLLGRDADRQKLAELSQKHKLVLLKAAAGIGKSILAKEFLRTHFTRVIEINMALSPDDNAPASERLPIILKELGEDTTDNFGLNLEALKRRLLDKSQPPIAFLLDNLEPALDSDFKFLEKLRDYEGLLQVLGDRDVCSFTLITSRLELIVQRVKVHEYSLQGLDIEAWREYFHDYENGATSEALEQLCVAYNGNAKVMDILHGTITNRFDGNIAAYWNRYKDALLADAELETLISVEMDWLRDNQPDAYKLLCRMGCYRYQDVKTVPFEGLICLLWDVLESREACIVNYLSKSSLIEAKKSEYYLHPVVRDAAKSNLQENKIDWETANYKAAEFWTKAIKEIETIDEALTAFEAYHHYMQINDFDEAGKVIAKKRKNRHGKDEHLGRSFYRLGLLNHMTLLISSILKNVSSNYILTGQLYNILGDHYWLIGNVSKAIDCHELSGDSAKDFCTVIQNSNNHEDFYLIRWLRLNYLFNIGLCKIDLWEIIESLDIFLRAFQQAEEEIILKPDNLLYVHYVNNICCQAFLNSVLAKPDKALELSYLAISEIERRFMDFDSWSKGYNLLFLGLTYKNLLRLDDSLKIYHQAISYAEESSYIQVKSRALTGLAEIYRIKNDFEAATSHHLESIKLLNKIGAKCDLAEAYFQLGLTYQAMGEHDQAETYKVKSLELFEQMEAPKQIDRVNQAFEQGTQQ